MNAPVVLSCLVFLLYLLLLPAGPEAMFSDPDTYWHIASGDLIRKLGTVPYSDSWSMTAGSIRWYNISWLWDMLMSYTYQQAGWYGVVIVNSITIAASLALLFANCLIRSRSGISAFVAMMLVPFTLTTCTIRPGQFSQFFIALVMLLLRLASQHSLSRRWLAIIPIIMVPWANIHGGFLVTFFILGIYGIEAISTKNREFFIALLLTGMASLLATGINPWGIDLYVGVMRTMDNGAGYMIQEWGPLSFSAAYAPQIIYLLLFLLLVIMRPLRLAKSEKWLSYSWLVLGLHSIRHLAIFAVMSAPALAVGLRNTLFILPVKPRPQPKWVAALSSKSAQLITTTKASVAAVIVCLTLSVLLFNPAFRHLYGMESINPLPDLSEELAFIQKAQPPLKLLNSYNLGGVLIFLTHGHMPIFIDGREGTAYPRSVITDYMAFRTESKGWLTIFDRYGLDGAMVPNSDDAFIDRFATRKGWHQAFKGQTATIFLRDKP